MEKSLPLGLAEKAKSLPLVLVEKILSSASVGKALNNPASNEDNVYRDPLQYHKAGQRRENLEL